MIKGDSSRSGGDSSRILWGASRSPPPPPPLPRRRLLRRLLFPVRLAFGRLACGLACGRRGFARRLLGFGRRRRRRRLAFGRHGAARHSSSLFCARSGVCTVAGWPKISGNVASSFAARSRVHSAASFTGTSTISRSVRISSAAYVSGFQLCFAASSTISRSARSSSATVLGPPIHLHGLEHDFGVRPEHFGL